MLDRTLAVVVLSCSVVFSGCEPAGSPGQEPAAAGTARDGGTDTRPSGTPAARPAEQRTEPGTTSAEVADPAGSERTPEPKPAVDEPRPAPVPDAAPSIPEAEAAEEDAEGDDPAGSMAEGVPGGGVQDADPQAPKVVMPRAGEPTAVLGERATATLRAASVIPVVVVADSPWSYLDAISHWTRERRFPVLIDDGSTRAADDIGRFVRAFGPKAVVSYASGAAKPATRALTAVRIDTAVGRAWGMEKDVSRTAELVAHWGSVGHVPPGVVVADASQEAWTAAAALSAARGQPIFWTTLDRSVNANMSLERANDVCMRIETFCDEIGLPWAKLGDAIDAVTLCADVPVRFLFAEAPGEDGTVKHMVALTDYVGRHRAGRAQEGRWGWAGMIHGNAAEASYRAMSAIFLTPRSAWVFDSYTEPGVWQKHDGGEAKKALERAGWSVRLDDAPNATTVQWRGAAARPVDAGLILVTTMGNSTFFDLGRGDRATPGDLPVLDRPAMLHFVHSWSLQTPGREATVGGRWLERGVYAYAGSVQEPFLSAFVPTPLVAERVAGGIPWGAAVRVETMPSWRVAVLGDPLITAGPGSEARIVDEPLPLEGTVDLDSELRSAVRGREFARAMRLMTLLARDTEAARLAAAILRDDEAAMTPDAAAYAVGPAFRAEDLDLLARVQQRMAAEEAKRSRAMDPLWNLARARVASLDSEARGRALDVLRASVRESQLAADGIELTRWLARYKGRPEAEAFAQSIRPKVTQKNDQRALDKAVGGG